MKTRWIRASRTSTPLRLTVILFAVFVAASLTSFAVAYWVIRAEFDATLHAQVRQTMASYRTLDDPAELRERLRSDIATTDPATTILSFIPDAGPGISNVAGFPPVSGFAIIPDQMIDGEDLADSYLALSARIGGGQLIVAQTRGQIVEMGEIILTVCLIGLLPTFLLVAGIGALVARRANRKLERIEGTLRELTGGELSARVADTGEADDLGRIGQAVNRMAHAQEASVAALRQATSDIAHDLKTPIQRVANHLHRLSARTRTTPDQDVIIAAALDETGRIVKTFHALLHIAQIEGGTVGDQFTLTDLRNVVTDFVEIYGPSAEDAGHSLTLAVNGPGPFDIIGDKHLLGQVVANLIENALRHVPGGGQIRLAVSTQHDRVVLTVRDDGPGIPADERTAVLRRLYRLERSRTSDGNGLGLSLVAAICDLHGASLTLGDNAPGLIITMAFPPA